MIAKKMLMVLAVALMVFPVMAQDKPVRGMLVSITAEQVVIKNKRIGEKAFKMTPETKVLDKDGNDVAVADFEAKVAAITVAADDADTAVVVQEGVLSKKKKKKKKTEE